MLHVGGARTALFNWLFARHQSGTFILRIEDTDRARFDPAALADITESLRWLGLDWDEGPGTRGPHEPYCQSERTEFYQYYADVLVRKRHAYRCYCAPERLDEMRKEQERSGSPPGYDRKCRDLGEDECARLDAADTPFAVRYRVPREGVTVFTDVIRGEIAYPNAQQDDFILLKRDGFPTYHLANVVDDRLMDITHVMRGDEWIPSTPKHMLLYASLGWEAPVFAHLPIILAPGGGKLSKRHGAASVSEYRDMGYLPEALTNFIALLGWSAGADRDIVPRDEMVRLFSLEHINKTGAQFDREKLNWMNGAYLRQRTVDEVTALARPWLEKAGLVTAATRPEELRHAMGLAQARMQVLPDAVTQCRCFLSDEIPYDEDAVRKVLRKEGVREHLEALGARLGQVAEAEFTTARLEQVVQAYLAESGEPLKKVVQPLRVAVTGTTASPGIYETLVGIGRSRALKRIEHAATRLCGGAGE